MMERVIVASALSFGPTLSRMVLSTVSILLGPSTCQRQYRSDPVASPAHPASLLSVGAFSMPYAVPPQVS